MSFNVNLNFSLDIAENILLQSGLNFKNERSVEKNKISEIDFTELYQPLSITQPFVQQPSNQVNILDAIKVESGSDNETVSFVSARSQATENIEGQVAQDDSNETGSYKTIITGMPGQTTSIRQPLIQEVNNNNQGVTQRAQSLPTGKDKKKASSSSQSLSFQSVLSAASQQQDPTKIDKTDSSVTGSYKSVKNDYQSSRRDAATMQTDSIFYSVKVEDELKVSPIKSSKNDTDYKDVYSSSKKDSTIRKVFNIPQDDGESDSPIPEWFNKMENDRFSLEYSYADIQTKTVSFQQSRAAISSAQSLRSSSTAKPPPATKRTSTSVQVASDKKVKPIKLEPIKGQDPTVSTVEKELDKHIFSIILKDQSLFDNLLVYLNQNLENKIVDIKPCDTTHKFFISYRSNEVNLNNLDNFFNEYIKLNIVKDEYTLTSELMECLAAENRTESIFKVPENMYFVIEEDKVIYYGGIKCNDIREHTVQFTSLYQLVAICCDEAHGSFFNFFNESNFYISQENIRTLKLEFKGTYFEYTFLNAFIKVVDYEVEDLKEGDSITLSVNKRFHPAVNLLIENKQRLITNLTRRINNRFEAKVQSRFIQFSCDTQFRNDYLKELYEILAELTVTKEIKLEKKNVDDGFYDKLIDDYIVILETAAPLYYFELQVDNASDPKENKILYCFVKIDDHNEFDTLDESSGKELFFTLKELYFLEKDEFWCYHTEMKKVKYKFIPMESRVTVFGSKKYVTLLHTYALIFTNLYLKILVLDYLNDAHSYELLRLIRNEISIDLNAKGIDHYFEFNDYRSQIKFTTSTKTRGDYMESWKILYNEIYKRFAFSPEIVIYKADDEEFEKFLKTKALDCHYKMRGRKKSNLTSNYNNLLYSQDFDELLKKEYSYCLSKIYKEDRKIFIIVKPGAQIKNCSRFVAQLYLTGAGCTTPEKKLSDSIKKMVSDVTRIHMSLDPALSEKIYRAMNYYFKKLIEPPAGISFCYDNFRYSFYAFKKDNNILEDFCNSLNHQTKLGFNYRAVLAKYNDIVEKEKWHRFTKDAYKHMLLEHNDWKTLAHSRLFNVQVDYQQDNDGYIILEGQKNFVFVLYAYLEYYFSNILTLRIKKVLVKIDELERDINALKENHEKILIKNYDSSKFLYVYIFTSLEKKLKYRNPYEEKKFLINLIQKTKKKFVIEKFDHYKKHAPPMLVSDFAGTLVEIECVETSVVSITTFFDLLGYEEITNEAGFEKDAEKFFNQLLRRKDINVSFIFENKVFYMCGLKNDVDNVLLEMVKYENENMPILSTLKKMFHYVKNKITN